ncbi:MAG: sugar phosphate nucleotidyltransferase [Anaerolineae bacterium]
MNNMAMVLAGGEGPGLGVLTAVRSEAALPFGGKYRVIDFTLSNCVNSGIYNVPVLTQYEPRSLNEHIGTGRPWDLDRGRGGVRLLQPYQSRRGETGAWQGGTADAVRFNLDVINDSIDNVLILSGDHIYKMDFNPLLQAHADTNADLTLAVRTVSPHDAHRFGMVGLDSERRVEVFEEKPARTRNTLASMGVYVFKREALVNWLNGAGHSQHDFGREVIPSLLKEGKVYAHVFNGYWMDVGNIQAYFEANMALLAETPALDLYDPDWVIHTRSEERPAAYIDAEARVDGTLLCDGAQIEGTALRSIISAGVYVARGAIVRDSIVMNDTWIGAGAVVDHAILDKGVRVGAGACVGEGDDNTPNQKSPERLNTGLVVVGKRTVIPAKLAIGRNVELGGYLKDKDFPADRVESGATIIR